MADHLREGAHHQPWTTRHIKDGVVWSSARKIHHKVHGLFILNAWRSGEGNSLFSKLIEDEILVSGHGILPACGAHSRAPLHTSYCCSFSRTNLPISVQLTRRHSGCAMSAVR